MRHYNGKEFFKPNWLKRIHDWIFGVGAYVKMSKQHVMVIVPTLDRMVTDSIATFFAQCGRKNADPDFPYKFTCGTLSKIQGYANMRNRAAKMFLDGPCDRLWFIDNDTLLPDEIFDLLPIDGDIVTLPYPFAGTFCPAIMNYKDVDDFDGGLEEIKVGPGGIADVKGTGMGCTLIRREVLEDARMRYPPEYLRPDGKPCTLDDEPDAQPAIFRFHYKPNGEILLGEDFDFCIRAKRLGYSIRVKLTSQCDHLKTVALNEAREHILEMHTKPRADTQVIAV